MAIIKGEAGKTLKRVAYPRGPRGATKTGPAGCLSGAQLFLELVLDAAEGGLQAV